MDAKKCFSEKQRFEELIRLVISHQKIEPEELATVFRDLLDGKLNKANETSLGALLAALQTRGVQDEEVVALFKVVLDYDRILVRVKITPEDLYGIVGSGKDEFKTYNISTCAAFVAAAMGVPVVKNGSRSDTSVAGTSDLMEYFGYPIEKAKNIYDKSLAVSNLAFCDASSYFPRMSKEYVGKVLFINPLCYLLSVASGIEFNNIVFGISFDDTERVCTLLRRIGLKSALVVCGKTEDGRRFDEISSVGPTKISELRNGLIKTYEVTPEELGIKRAALVDIKQPESLAASQKIFLDVLKGSASSSTSGIVAANAGALYYLKNFATNISLAESVKKAQQVIDSGEAFVNFEKFLKVSI